MRTTVWFAMALVVVGLQVPVPAEAKDAPKEAIVCPVMGMPVPDPDHAPKSVYQGRTYYFCCPSCKEKFDKDPEKYLKKAGETSRDPGTCSPAATCQGSGHTH